MNSLKIPQKSSGCTTKIFNHLITDKIIQTINFPPPFLNLLSISHLSANCNFIPQIYNQRLPRKYSVSIDQVVPPRTHYCRLSLIKYRSIYQSAHEGIAISFNIVIISVYVRTGSCWVTWRKLRKFHRFRNQFLVNKENAELIFIQIHFETFFWCLQLQSNFLPLSKLHKNIFLLKFFTFEFVWKQCRWKVMMM